MRSRIDDLNLLDRRNLRHYFAGMATEAAAFLILTALAGLVVLLCSRIWY
jgi:hypothetical protein